ncbi:MAG: oxidoreductase, partial [Sphingobacteriales bacterium]|nr:oxidoreductase [Sphingobacteriales bacterium]
YPVMAATIAKQKGATAVFIVTAVGANPTSTIFYVRTKGETERDMIALDFEHTHIFHPSLIMGNRKENRPLEKIFIQIWSVINKLFIGPLKNYRGIDGKDIAKAMNNAAKKQSEKIKVYHWKEMNDLL